MSWTVSIHPKTLHFKEPATTSRGVYQVHEIWYVQIRDESGAFGVGECAPLTDLSCDYAPNYDQRVKDCALAFARTGDVYASAPKELPSIRFGLETALLHAQKGSIRFFDTPFSRGEEGIPINGLIWMGDHQTMLSRLEAKIAEGFRCIKLKIGAIDFSLELDLMRRIRDRFPSSEELELRLDANGAFTPKNAMQRLEALAAFHPHSIEQPIRQGQWKEMGLLCKETPIPIALDEELIGINDRGEKERMLDAVRPQYVILKPTLHGGLKGSEEWMALAGERGAKNWATSALESNVGLNSIAQWCAKNGSSMPQGLGTGKLFLDNMDDYPLSIQRSALHFDPSAKEPDFLSFLGHGETLHS